MKGLDLSRSAISAAAISLLVGCGGTQPPIGATAVAKLPIDGREHKGSETYTYTGNSQTFNVPKRVTRVTVTASGASGGIAYGAGFSGLGGRVKATVPVTPGESLAIYVGGAGTPYAGGYNGGASGGVARGCSSVPCAGGGGGASDVRQGGSALVDRIVVAGGGGGQGCCNNGNGGNGGGAKGDPGLRGSASYGGFGGQGGRGGRQNHGGLGGKGGSSRYGYCPGSGGLYGTLGVGGQGGTVSCEQVVTGGGGAGGYYGGGGGGAGCGVCGSSSYITAGGGGGGGSSHVESQATNVKDEEGAATPGDGQIIITWYIE